jgi:hypothetical protein
LTAIFTHIPIDLHVVTSDNEPMSTDTATTGKHELEEALDRVATGKRDPERMRRAVAELNRSREETRKRIGTVEAAVELIRDARDQ